MKNIVYLDDLFRSDFIEARRFIYGLLDQPLRQLGFNVPNISQATLERGLSPQFDIKTFLNLAESTSWLPNYHQTNPRASCYLREHIPSDALIIGYEMPPWLCHILDEHQALYVDIRISPERFARDLYFNIRTSLNNEAIKGFHACDNEVLLEAGLMKAALLHHGSTLSTSQKLDNSVVIIGQTSNDASKVNNDARVVAFADYKAAVSKYTKGRRVFYKPHPYDREMANTDIKQITEITGQKPTKWKASAYRTLANFSNAKILTLSSGVAQEAAFFQREAKTLFQPWFYSPETTDSFTRVRAQDFMSPQLWASLFSISGKFASLPKIQRNLLRSLHNTWWGYSDFQIETDSFWTIVANSQIPKKSKPFKRLKEKLGLK